jgi:hypothetical protein
MITNYWDFRSKENKNFVKEKKCLSSSPLKIKDICDYIKFAAGCCKNFFNEISLQKIKKTVY